MSPYAAIPPAVRGVGRSTFRVTGNPSCTGPFFVHQHEAGEMRDEALPDGQFAGCGFGQGRQYQACRVCRNPFGQRVALHSSRGRFAAPCRAHADIAPDRAYRFGKIALWRAFSCSWAIRFVRKPCRAACRALSTSRPETEMYIAPRKRREMTYVGFQAVLAHQHDEYSAALPAQGGVRRGHNFSRP